MKISERVDRLEEKVNMIDKKLLVVIILILIFLPLGASTGALKGALTGFAALEVTHTMEPILIFALIAFAGSLFRGYLGYLKNKENGATFDYQMLLISAVPTISAALGSAYFINLEASIANFVLVFFGAAGINSLQDKFGLQKKH